MEDILKQPGQHKYTATEFRRLFHRLLSHCDDADINILFESLSPAMIFPKGHVLINQNRFSNTLHFICDGLLSVSIDTIDHDYQLGMLSGGQWVGDVSLIEPGDASATVTVLEDATIVSLDQNSFTRLRQDHPRTASRLMHALSLELVNRLRMSREISLTNIDDDDQQQSAGTGRLGNFKLGLGRWLSGIQVEDSEEFSTATLKSQQQVLNKKYQHLFQQEKDNLLQTERDRILAELHDGVGGQLVAMLSILENRDVNADELKDIVRNALDDLRMMIDSLDAVEGDIPVVLGMFRSRLEPRLSLQNISFEWRVTDLPLVSRFGPHEVLHVLRILQEAVCNIIKHSGASKITLATGSCSGEKNEALIKISVRDNGKGLKPGYDSTGYGMNTMQGRAAEIGAALRVESGESGTLVELIIPVAAGQSDKE